MYRRSVKTFFGLLAILLLAGSIDAKEALNEGKIRVLVITGGHGFEADPFFAIFKSIPDVAMDWAKYPDAAALLTPALTKKYDTVVFYDMWNEGLTPEQQKAFVGLLDKGIGVVALHHTLAAHEEWPEYCKIIGGKYFRKEHVVHGKKVPSSQYAHSEDLNVHIATQAHPITAGLKDFSIHDETYQNFFTAPDVQVLLTTDHPKNDPKLAWVKTYGNSRVFYLQLGHDHFAYDNPNYRTLVARGIRWTAGRPANGSASWKPLFNGKDLTGWKPEGKAIWEVIDGQLIGRQGDGNTPGDLLTEASFDDFELKVTYRIVWPANSGVWYRYQSPKKTYQADILEYKDPFALSGSLYCPGKMFIAINKDARIINREGWNTLVIRAAATRQVIFLNGKKVADVHDSLSDHGRVGFQVHPGDQFGPMRIIVREIVIRPL